MVDKKQRKGLENMSRGGVKLIHPPLVTVRPKLFRRASLTSWGKDNLAMTRAAADVNLKELMLTVQQQKKLFSKDAFAYASYLQFEDQKKADQRKVTKEESHIQGNALAFRHYRRRCLLSRSKARREFYSEWEKNCRMKWKSNQAALCRYERRLLNYELAIIEKESAQKRISRDMHLKDQIKGIQWFEKNLDRLGLDLNSGGNDPSDSPFAPCKDSQATYQKKIMQQYIEQGFDPSSNAEMMEQLRIQGDAGRKARKDRHYRRHKTDCDQRRAQAEANAQCEEEQRLKFMIDSGRQRRATAGAHLEKSHKKANEAQFTAMRLQILAEKHREHFDVVFQERASGIRKRFCAEENAREAERRAHNILQQARVENKWHRAEVLCREAVHKLIDLTVVASELRSGQCGKPLTPTLWKALKSRYISPQPFHKAEKTLDPHNARNPTLKAKASLQLQDLLDCKGEWQYNREATTAVGLNMTDPIEAALNSARELVQHNMQPLRESPSCGTLTLKVVIRGPLMQPSNIFWELGQWAGLYVCDLEQALVCAMEVASDHKGDHQGLADDGIVGVGQGGDAGDSSDNGARDKFVETGTQNLEPFSPLALEEDINSFKELAATFYELKTNPKKALLPVPLKMTTELLVKHLDCKAPGGGWLLVNYPRTLLEAKLLENSLSGYSDDDVVTELNGGKRPRNTKRSSAGRNSVQVGISPHQLGAGLDGVIDVISTNFSTDSAAKEAGEVYETGEICSTGGKNEVQATSGSSTNEVNLEGDEFVRWWRTFAGNYLYCSIKCEVNRELLLETLFLLLGATEHGKGLRDSHSNTQTNCKPNEGEQVSPLILQGCTENERDKVEEGGISNSMSPPPPADPLPWELSLTHGLEQRRSARRFGMSHVNRIVQGVLTGERELDVEGICTALALWKSFKEDFQQRVLSTLFLLERECVAPNLLCQVIMSEFTYTSGLCTPNQRWSLACMLLEEKISVFARQVASLPWDIAQRQPLSKRFVGIRSPTKKGKGVQGSQHWVQDGTRKATKGGKTRSPVLIAETWSRVTTETTHGPCQPHCDFLANDVPVPPAPDHSIWEAINDFEVEAGDVVDDRHQAAEAELFRFESESAGQVTAWRTGTVLLATELCLIILQRHGCALKLLESLHTLVGLEEVCNSFVDDEVVGVDCRREGQGAPVGEGSLQSTIDASIAALRSEISVLIATRDLGNSGVQLLDVVHNVCNEPRDRGRIGSVLEAGASDTGGSSNGNNCGLHKGEDGQALPSEGQDGVLARAFLQSQLLSVCRIRGVVARLARVFDLCEGFVSAAQKRFRDLKRRRIELEHHAVESTATAIRQTLAAGDGNALWDVLQSGVVAFLLCVHEATSQTAPISAPSASPASLAPSCGHEFCLGLCQYITLVENTLKIRIQDVETYVVDPYVALSWGMNGLELRLVSSLAACLLATSCGSSLMSLSVIIQVIWDWATSATKEKGDSKGGLCQPSSAWTDEAYLYQLCRALANGKATGVPWKRLVHSLLLGHLHVLPSLDDLITMMAAFQQQEYITAECASEGCANLRFWFEDMPGLEGKSFDQENDVIRSAREVYLETFYEEDSKGPGLELLLTLCTVPLNVMNYMSRGIDGGVPFCEGMFRAFMMFANSEEEGASAAECCGGVDDIGRGPYVTQRQLQSILAFAGMSEEETQTVYEEALEKGREEVEKAMAGTGRGVVGDVHTGEGNGEEKKEENGPKTGVENPEQELLVEEGERKDGGKIQHADEERVVAEGIETIAGEVSTESLGVLEAGQVMNGEGPTVEENTERGDGTETVKKVSFSAVSASLAVCDLVRAGAFTLPGFDTTAGNIDVEKERCSVNGLLNNSDCPGENVLKTDACASNV